MSTLMPVSFSHRSLIGRRSVRERLGELANGAIRQSQHNAVDARSLELFRGFDCATLGSVGGILIALASCQQLLLPAITAVVVGGTAIRGGVGSIGHTVVGALIVSIVRIGMTYTGINIFAQQIVFGAALIFAVFVTIDRSKLAIIK